MAVDVFAVPVFLIVFRETLETTIIVSVLLAFLKQTLDGPDGDVKVYKRLVRQVWLGTGIGFLICLIIGGACIGSFYRFGSQAWELNENAYEGAFALVAAIIISIMGAALLRVGKMQSKWRVKLAKAMDRPLREGGGGKRGWFKRFSERYAMFLLPFITVLREGVEAVVFVAGVSFSFPAKSIPLPTVVGLAVGSLIGYALYKGGSSTKLQLFLVLSTCLLYLVAAGLFSRAVWHFEMQRYSDLIGGEASEFGAGPGSYDIDSSVWHVNCCAPNTSSDGGGGWGIFNAILGWTNSATYGSVISYNLYWGAVALAFFIMRFRETKGRYPFMKARAAKAPVAASSPADDSSEAAVEGDKNHTNEKTATA